LAVIGRGSYGKVFQVRKKSNDKLYAMKVLKKKEIIKRKVVNHTKSERSVLEAIAHPFIVNLRHAFQTDSKLYLILDYVPGGELFSRLDREIELPEKEACFYAAEVVLALEHLHSLDFIYRDLKPKNILLDAGGHICLTDFGFAKKLIEAEGDSKTFCGTIHYMAPEIINNTGHGKCADWWALGVLIYEMITGKTPFYAKNRKDIQQKILTAALKFPRWMSPDCQSLLKGLMRRPVHKRLGVNGAAEIKTHGFFKDVDWDKLSAKKMVPPYKPVLEGPLDLSNFDKQFTSEAPIDSPSTPTHLPIHSPFVGFSYTGNESPTLASLVGRDRGGSDARGGERVARIGSVGGGDGPPGGASGQGAMGASLTTAAASGLLLSGIASLQPGSGIAIFSEVDNE